MRFIGYVFSEAFRSLWRSKLSSFLSSLTTGFALFLLGISFLVSVNLGYIYTVAEQQMEIQAYIIKDATAEQISTAVERVQGIPGVSTVKYVSKEDALEELKLMFKDKASVLDSLKEENPLPASIRVKTTGVDEIDAVVAEIQTLDIIDDVIYQEEVSRRMMSIGRAIQYVSLGGMVAVGAVSIMVIGNSIRLTIDSRRHEIAVMKLVGATDGFVVGPFILEGVVIGIVGSILGTFFAVGIYNWLSERLYEFIPFMPMYVLDTQSKLQMFGIMAITGIVVGAAGSVLSVRRHLKV
ncbi:MAG: permease-like cell division protein FtsX [Firmicutes bacterium]|nr:permease-like cell division protein FtsX [Candidatus Fermentithermobacillaceae bacterium]